MSKIGLPRTRRSMPAPEIGGRPLAPRVDSEQPLRRAIAVSTAKAQVTLSSLRSRFRTSDPESLLRVSQPPRIPIAVASPFVSLDGFVRRRLRALLRKQDKRPGSGRTPLDHIRWPNAFFASAGCSHSTQRGSPRDTPDEETTDCKVGCEKIARTARREGRASALSYPYRREDRPQSPSNKAFTALKIATAAA